jgi:hypothetical protein
VHRWMIKLAPSFGGAPVQCLSDRCMTEAAAIGISRSSFL